MKKLSRDCRHALTWSRGCKNITQNKNKRKGKRKMKREIIKLETCGNTEIGHVTKCNGLIKIKNDQNLHDAFTKAGIVTSPVNSENIYFNGYNDNYYIFNGWESDEFGLIVKKPKFIEMINVTDLIK